MKSSGNGKGNTVVTVLDFLEAGKKALHLELIAGEAGLKNRINEAAINRPGLVLAGFFEHFSFRRVQVLGLAECAYLSSLSETEREKRLRGFFDARVPCVIISRNKKVFPEVIALAEEFKVPVLRTKMVTKYFVNTATFIMENLRAPHAKVQGTMVEIMGIGVLLEGEPGIGKSEAALGLIKKGYALVSDDITAFRVDSAGALLGAPVRSTRFHMEIRGIGIVHIPSLFGVAAVREEKKLDLVVSLQRMSVQTEEDRSNCCEHSRSVLGIKVPQVIIPVGPGRDIVNVVETAALDQKLKRLGHDAAKELDERLMDLMTGGMNGSE
ncbi:MAG: HPr(Ser) kinase/phosphatase [Kiritimatiellae bacterium]|nr:HPr(Ser) kinase/phosphatase [Kiritimatiellia bacterium]